MRRNRTRMGFTLIELLVVIAIIALLIGILLPALGEARRTAKLAISLSNLRQFSVAAATYASDFEDRIYAFTAAPNTKYNDIRATQPPPVGNETSSLRWAVGQAIDIIRRRTGRDSGSEIFPIPLNWIPHVLYSHLILNDYLAQRLPEKMVVSPEDEHRINWQIDPVNNFDLGVWQPYQEPSPGTGRVVPPDQKRWPYSSTYQAVVASYDSGQSRWGAPREVISQASHNSYGVPRTGLKLGDLRMSSVSFPATKVHVMDSEGRHSGRKNIYYVQPQAKVVMHMFDGSAALRQTSDSNQGWIPTQPRNLNPTVFNYNPRPWEAPAIDPRGADRRVVGHYRWTRGGLRGVDFDSNEIDTGQMP